MVKRKVEELQVDVLAKQVSAVNLFGIVGGEGGYRAGDSRHIYIFVPCILITRLSAL